MKLLPLAVALAVLATGSAHAADHQCVSLSVIDKTQAINDSTVLIKLRGRDRFMRMDMAGRCPGLQFHGFIHEAHQNELCTSDPLHVIEPVGAVCMIDKIVDISPDEGKALQRRKQ